jgi:hypothetical protein
MMIPSLLESKALFREICLMGCRYYDMSRMVVGGFEHVMRMDVDPPV